MASASLYLQGHCKTSRWYLSIFVIIIILEITAHAIAISSYATSISTALYSVWTEDVKEFIFSHLQSITARTKDVRLSEWSLLVCHRSVSYAELGHACKMARLIMKPIITWADKKESYPNWTSCDKFYLGIFCIVVQLSDLSVITNSIELYFFLRCISRVVDNIFFGSFPGLNPHDSGGGYSVDKKHV